MRKIRWSKTKHTVDMFLVGSRTHRIGSRHQAGRIFQLYLIPGLAIAGRKLAFGKDSGVHSTWASPYLVAEVHLSSLLRAACALGQGLSYGGQPFASHSQTIPQDLTMILGKQVARSNVAVLATAVTRSQTAISAHRWSVIVVEVRVVMRQAVRFLVPVVP